jgi:hypothetical protein
MFRRGSGIRVAAVVGAAVTAFAAVAAAGPVAAQPTAPGMRTAPASDAGMPYIGEKTTMRMGPFHLAPAPIGTLPNQNRVVPDVTKPCTDCFITGIVPKLEYADGTRADMATGVMLHHLVIADTSRPDATCDREDGIGAIGQRLFASGDERTPFSLPKGYGYPVKQGKWVGIIELMNHSTMPKDVYYTADVYHLPASTKGMTAVTPVWLDIANCSDSQYSVPAGRSSTAWAWTSSITGKIIAAAGHVHAGGVGTILENASTGKRICSSQAGYGMGAMPGMEGHDMAGMAGHDMPGMEGHDAMANMVTSMSSCAWDRLGTVKAGQKLKITSLYDAPKAMKGVMGIMLIAVAETKDLKSGTAAPASMRRTPSTKVPAGVAESDSMLGIDGLGHGH